MLAVVLWVLTDEENNHNRIINHNSSKVIFQEQYSYVRDICCFVALFGAYLDWCLLSNPKDFMPTAHSSENLL